MHIGKSPSASPSASSPALAASAPTLSYGRYMSEYDERLRPHVDGTRFADSEGLLCSHLASAPFQISVAALRVCPVRVRADGRMTAEEFEVPRELPRCKGVPLAESAMHRSLINGCPPMPQGTLELSPSFMCVMWGGPWFPQAF